mmetsp:Transcript_43898/g.86101  ORF Transcript_43898/g.86101 Transcript_43898/m.86101 type:complete len:151 (-) Transcript_43898:60-512(-)
MLLRARGVELPLQACRGCGSPGGAAAPDYHCGTAPRQSKGGLPSDAGVSSCYNSNIPAEVLFEGINRGAEAQHLILEPEHRQTYHSEQAVHIELKSGVHYICLLLYLKCGSEVQKFRSQCSKEEAKRKSSSNVAKKRHGDRDRANNKENY